MYDGSLYRVADWCIWQSMVLDAVPAGNRARLGAGGLPINAMAGLFRIRTIIRDTARKFITAAPVMPHGRIQNARRG